MGWCQRSALDARGQTNKSIPTRNCSGSCCINPDRRRTPDGDILRIASTKMVSKFRRQHPYYNYILDSPVCVERKLVVEVDGGQFANKPGDLQRWIPAERWLPSRAGITTY